MSEIKIAWLCDHNRCEDCHPWPDNKLEVCRHTFDINHSFNVQRNKNTIVKFNMRCIRGVDGGPSKIYLEEEPTAVSLAEWIRDENGTYHCSACQSRIPGEQRVYARYCLNCGRRMENEEKL